MAESPRRVDLRLSIPAAAPYLAVAAEMLERFAAYVGADSGAAKSLAQATVAAITPAADAQPDTPIDLQMSAHGRELVVTANAGSTTKRTTCALPD
jgi:hypothetical protein